MAVRSTLAAALAFALTTTVTTSAQVPTPTIEGPITSPGVPFVATTSFDLAQVGYEQAEYFISGTAIAYTNTAPLGEDGMWSVAPADTAAYKTRILVYRPSDPKKFRGTVAVEWLNVSGGVDAGPNWTQSHVELIREGVAWVGVSAQIVGVEGGPPLLPGLGSNPLKKVDPARYGSLHHPGDSFSYDIFSQAAQAVRLPSGPSPLGGLKAKRLIAAGESQSAGRLVPYINAIHPLTHVFDGFLVHSRGGFPTPLSEAPQPSIVSPGAVIRGDIDVPVLTFETETDLTVLGYFSARQDDSENFRLWEVAGTAHYDSYGLVVGMTDIGDSPDVAAVVSISSAAGGFIDCDTPFNSGPQHFVLNAAWSKLIRWVRTGKAPKSAPRLDVSAGPVAIQRDANGNALGGIRTPYVDTPIATLQEQGAGSIACLIFGSTTLFDPAKLASLYPTHKAFTSAYNKSLKRAVKKGWIRTPDAKLMKKWAAGSGIGG